jgi:hypothetical protein
MNEGFTEWLAQQMPGFKPHPDMAAYEQEVEIVQRLFDETKVSPEIIKRAYFLGDEQAIIKIKEGMERLAPGFKDQSINPLPSLDDN